VPLDLYHSCYAEELFRDSEYPSNFSENRETRPHRLLTTRHGAGSIASHLPSTRFAEGPLAEMPKDILSELGQYDEAGGGEGGDATSK